VNGNACRENRAELAARRRQLMALGDEHAPARHEARKKETRLRGVETGPRSAEL
jgi:hypothetical protein